MSVKVALVLAVLACCQAAPKPHILWILVDDFGWSEVSWHRDKTHQRDEHTPTMQMLMNEGIELDRHYVYKYCSPTRSAIQSGRNPIHVNVLNVAPTLHNPADPIGGYQGIPRNMTGVAEHMQKAGYKTHQVGKWDAGMATPQHTPQGRGYDTSLGYFHHANDYWNSKVGKFTDLWNTDHPANHLNNSWSCAQKDQVSGCVYEDALFLSAVKDAVENHPKEDPLFMFWAPHIVHTPLQIPQAYVDRYSYIQQNHARMMYHAMVAWLDDGIKVIVDVLKQRGMWDNTLLVLHADNGGPIYSYGDAGSNNWPLRGGKMSNWEGGIRVNGLVSGGFLPKSVRGTKLEGYICGWDWYSTFCHLAGVDPTDHKAAAAGLPPIDSINQWPYLSGQNTTAPRTDIPIGTSSSPSDNVPTEHGGLISGDMKLLVGNLSQSCWTGPIWPNATRFNPSDQMQTCGETPETGCLFNIKEDPTEHNNLAASSPKIWHQMYSRMKQIPLYSPNRGKDDGLAEKIARERWGEFWGPFIDINGYKGPQ